MNEYVSDDVNYVSDVERGPEPKPRPLNIPNPFELMPKPSDALTAVIDGLREWDQRPNCEVDMGSFGHLQGGLCFGCAATCAVLHVFPNLPVVVSQRLTYLDGGTGWYRKDSWGLFEDMIDNLRSSGLVPYTLGRYYGMATNEVMNKILPSLGSTSWKNELIEWEEYRDELVKAGY